MTSREGERRDERAGMPGDGAGRREDPGETGVHPFGSPEAPDATVRTSAEWGQGTSGAAGYDESGSSEIRQSPPEVREAPSSSAGAVDSPGDVPAGEMGPADVPTEPSDPERGGS